MRHLLLLIAIAALHAGGEELLLWPEGAVPGSTSAAAKDVPRVFVYRPQVANGTAVVICPGGGYRGLAMQQEGGLAAQWLAERGVLAVVLRYRLPGDGHKHPAPINDAQRAVRLVRSRAAEWQVDPVRVGIMGFSAGGHLAATTATGGPEPRPGTPDALDAIDPRPSFLVAVYPCITFGEWAYGGLGMLLADPQDQVMRQALSAERRVDAATPPTFLVHSDGDSGVPAMNSILFYQALKRAKVPAELHIYDGGGHGWGFFCKPGNVGSQTWTARLEDWMRQRRLLDAPARPQ